MLSMDKRDRYNTGTSHEIYLTSLNTFANAAPAISSGVLMNALHPTILSCRQGREGRALT